MSTFVKVNSISWKKTGYGHWLVTLNIDNPALNYAENDYYWKTVDHDIEDEPEKLTLTKTTTNSRAIDGHDGYEHALANEVLMSYGYDIEDFDTSILCQEDED